MIESTICLAILPGRTTWSRSTEIGKRLGSSKDLLPYPGIVPLRICAIPFKEPFTIAKQARAFLANADETKCFALLSNIIEKEISKAPGGKFWNANKNWFLEFQ